jgi:hypothetical protein
MAEEKKIVIFDKEGKDTGEVRGPDEGYPKFILRQGAIGLVDTPGSFAGLWGLGAAGVDYAMERVRPPANGEAPKGFAQHLLDPEGGEQKLQEYNNKVIEDIKKARPEATPEDVQKRFDEIQKHSKRYYEETTPFYRPGMAFARKWGQGTNEFFGDPRLPPERTQADTLMNIAGSAAPTRGVGAITGGTGAVGRALGSIAATKAGRFALNVAEAATPVTIVPPGATTGGIAARVGANIAIPAAVDQGVRAYKGDPSIVADTVSSVKDFYTQDDGSTDVNRIGATGVIGTIMAGLAARRLANVVKPKITPVSAGPTSQAMQQAISPTVDPIRMGVANVGSDIEPFRTMGRHVSLSEDELTSFMTDTARNARGMAKADHDIFMQQKVAPVLEQFVREDPAFINKATQHFADSYRAWGDTEALARTTKEFNEALADLNTATGAGGRSTPQRIAELQKRVGELQMERQARIADVDPNLRHSIMNDDTATVRARLAQSRQDPRIRNVEAQVHRLYDSSFDEAAASGALSAAEAAKMKLEVRKGNYHLTDNPMAQKTFLENTRHWVEKNMVENPHIANSDPSAVLSLYRTANRERVRKGYGNAKGETRYAPTPGFEPHPRVNNPRDPFQELAHMDLRVRQAASHNRAMRDYTEMMMNSPGNIAGGRKILDIAHVHAESEIPKVISGIEADIAKRDAGKGPYKYVYRGEHGSLVEVIHNEKHIQEALKFAPAAVVPILNQSRKMLTAMTTGAGNPKFGLLVSNPYDFIAGSLLRHKSMAYGPISYMAHRTFGMGSMKARVISALAAGPEAAINVFASYPYYFVKSTISEFFGNILAKRWEVDLAKNTGIGKIPGAQALLGGITQAMSKAYDASMTNLTKTMKAGHVANASDDVLSLIRNINSITKKRPEWKSGANNYLGMLQVWLDVPKQMALSQNLKLYKRELAKGRQQAQYMSEAFIADQARMVGGDMARVSGAKWLQRVVSVAPWFNPNIQALRYLRQRVMEAPVENMTRLMSFGLVAAWAYNQVGSDKETNDWYFNQLPNDQRIKSIPFPDPFRYIGRQMGMNIPRGTPEQENILVPVPPEMMLIILPFIHGARALGLVKNPDVVVPQSLGDDMEHARDQVFGLATPPIAQSIAGLYGKKFEPGKLLGGESPFRDIREPQFAGVNKDMMSPQSRIPHAWYDAISGLLGTTISTTLEAANVADIHTRAPGGSIEKGLVEGGRKLGTSIALQTPGVSHLWPDANRRYIYTPIAEKRAKDFDILRKSIEAQLPAEAGIRRALQPHAKPNTLEKTDVAEGAVVGSPVADPDVRVIMAHVHKALFTGPYKQLEEQRRLERSKHEAMTVGTDPSIQQSPIMRFKAAQEQAKKVVALDRQLYTIYQDQWKQVKTSPSGKKFESKYGELTPENLAKAIHQSSREQGDLKPR